MTNKDFYKRIGCACFALIGMFVLFLLAMVALAYFGQPQF